MAQIRSKPFGVTKQGANVTEYILSNPGGLTVSVLDYGCIIKNIIVPAKNGPVDVVLGHDTMADYEDDFTSSGSTCCGARPRRPGGVVARAPAAASRRCTASGSSQAATRPRWRSGRLSAGERSSAPSQPVCSAWARSADAANSVGCSPVTAMRTMSAWRSLATRLASPAAQGGGPWLCVL